MIELIVAALGALVGIVILRSFDKYNISKQQEKLEKKVLDAKLKQAELAGEQRIEDAQTKEKVDAIDKEKDKNLNPSELADWFNNRRFK